MKRLTFLALTAALVLSVFCFTAAGSFAAEDVITFRDIPWGTRLNETEELIKQSGIDEGAEIHTDYSLMIPGINYRISRLHELVPWFPEPQKKASYLKTTNMVVDDSNLKVAGYNLNLDGLIMYFVYLPDEKGNIGYRSDSALFAAAYDIKAPGYDYDSTVADLKEKLAGVYGQKFIVDKRKVNGFGCTYYIWQGADDTYVVLCDLDGIGIFNSRRVMIVYASMEYENKAQEAMDRIEAEKEAQKTPTPFGNGDNNGL